MAERLTDIVTQIQNVRQLGSVVTAMRGIAASRAQKGRSLLAGIDAYSQVISHAIGQALSLLPPNAVTVSPRQRARTGLILFCAEQGFAGAYSERLLDAAAGDIDGATTLVVGTRGTVVMNERGIKPAWSAPMATHVDAIPGFANRVADTLYGYVATGAITKVGSGLLDFSGGALIADVQAIEHRVEKRPARTQKLAVNLLHNADEPFFEDRRDGSQWSAEDQAAGVLYAYRSAAHLGEPLSELSQSLQPLDDDPVSPSKPDACTTNHLQHARPGNRSTRR
jgi:hypothetical protein